MAFPVVEFQGRDTKLERFLAKNQLYLNEITKEPGNIEIVEFCTSEKCDIFSARLTGYKFVQNPSLDFCKVHLGKI